MNQVVSDDARENDRWTRLISALKSGLIVVNRDGKIAWMDENTRRRLNGHTSELDRALLKTGSDATECLLSPETVTVHGRSLPICIVREIDGHDRETMSKIEAVLSDTSSFARSVIERLKGLRIGATDPCTSSESDLDILTEREREILGLICRGRGDLQISEELKLSQNTVRNHVASLYRKLGVNRRSSAIIWARERGLTDDILGARRRLRRSSAAEPS